MDDLDQQFEKLEANLEALERRMPGLPLEGVLLTRMIIHLGRALTGLLEQHIRPFGLPEAEFRVLMALFSQPDGAANPGDLCGRTSHSPANMSRLSDALVARDLITRVPSAQDRRKTVLHITPQGEQLVRRLLPQFQEQLRDLVADLSLEEQRRMVSQLKLLGGRLQLAGNAVPPPA